MRKSKDPFPFYLFFLLLFFYMAQPFYQTYINVYQSYMGMSNTVIGAVSSVTAVVMIFFKPLMGALTDKAKNKNRLVALLLGLTAAVVLLFYLGYLLPPGTAILFIFIGICLLFYQMTYGSAGTLVEANAVELLGERSQKWNLGHIRWGGTVGFMISAFVSSFIIGGDHYERMFVIMAFFSIICAIWIWKLPPVTGKARKKERVSYSEIFKNRPFLVLLLLQFTNSMGQVFFRFFNIYLVDKSVNALGVANGLGMDSGIIGLIAFCNALIEMPFFWFAGKIKEKIGMRWFMFIAVMFTAVKNLLLSFATASSSILLIVTFTGFSFVGIHFCTLTFLNDEMPKKMRSTAQACSGLVSQVFGAVIGGPLGGWLSDQYSTPVMMRYGAAIIVLGAVLFFILFKKAVRYHNTHYGPNMVPLDADGLPAYETDENGDSV